MAIEIFKLPTREDYNNVNRLVYKKGTHVCLFLLGDIFQNSMVKNEDRKREVLFHTAPAPHINKLQI